jgi:hypothetical protein
MRGVFGECRPNYIEVNKNDKGWDPEYLGIYASFRDDGMRHGVRLHVESGRVEYMLRKEFQEPSLWMKGVPPDIYHKQLEAFLLLVI